MVTTDDDTAHVDAAEAQERLRTLHYKRLRKASTFEVGLAIAFMYLLFGRYWAQSSRDDPLTRLVEALYDPTLLISLLLLFAELFIHALTGQAILVGIYASRSKRLRRIFAPPISYRGGRGVVHDEFDQVIQRSSEALKAAQRRPNALLLVGTTVAMAGLLFFILTLPDFGFVDVSASGASPAQPEELTERLLTLLPRLLMLIFIQVLAGFFMRQYRVSMEELRYYEAILRERESQRLSFHIMSNHKEKILQDFAKSISTNHDRDTVRLQNGETTVILEAQKLEANEFKGIYGPLFELLKKPIEAVASKKNE